MKKSFIAFAAASIFMLSNNLTANTISIDNIDSITAFQDADQAEAEAETAAPSFTQVM